MGIFGNWLKKSESVVITIDSSRPIIVNSKKEAEFYASGMLQIVNDCVNLINSTKKPEVFFSRYGLMIEKLENLSKLEKFNCFSRSLPSQDLAKVLGKKLFTINDFLERYYTDTLEKIENLKTSKAKQKKIDAFSESLIAYKPYMLNENWVRYTNLCGSLERLALDKNKSLI